MKLWNCFYSLGNANFRGQSEGPPKGEPEDHAGVCVPCGDAVPAIHLALGDVAVHVTDCILESLYVISIVFAI